MATLYAILKYWEGTYKNIHISTATHPTTVNLVSNYSAVIALYMTIGYANNHFEFS